MAAAGTVAAGTAVADTVAEADSTAAVAAHGPFPACSLPDYPDQYGLGEVHPDENTARLVKR